MCGTRVNAQRGRGKRFGRRRSKPHDFHKSFPHTFFSSLSLLESLWTREWPLFFFLILSADIDDAILCTLFRPNILYRHQRGLIILLVRCFRGNRLALRIIVYMRRNTWRESTYNLSIILFGRNVITDNHGNQSGR